MGPSLMHQGRTELTWKPPGRVLNHTKVSLEGYALSQALIGTWGLKTLPQLDALDAADELTACHDFQVSLASLCLRLKNWTSWQQITLARNCSLRLSPAEASQQSHALGLHVCSNNCGLQSHLFPSSAHSWGLHRDHLHPQAAVCP